MPTVMVNDNGSIAWTDSKRFVVVDPSGTRWEHETREVALARVTAILVRNPNAHVLEDHEVHVDKPARSTYTVRYG